ITLTRGTFSPASLPVLDFLLERYDSMSNGFPGRARDRRNMILSPGEADAYLAVAESVYMKNRQSAERQGLPVMDKDCRLRIRIEKADEDPGGGLILRAMDAYRIIEGVRQVFILTDDALYRCSEEYSSASRELLKALASRKGGMFFSGKDVPALFANIMRKAEPYLEIEMDGGVGELVPPELETKVYFDMDENGYVTARMSFAYGEIKHDAFEDPKRPEVSLDPAGEAYAEHVLRHYVGQATYGPGTLIVLDNASREERLYTLATEGLDKIREFAEVFASESFGALKARPPMSVAVGVKIDGRLLTLNINAEGMDFSELAEILKSYRLAKKYHRLKDGSFLALEGDALGELSDLAEGLDLDPGKFVKDADNPGQSSIELDLSRALYIDSMMRKNESIRYDRDKNFRGLIRNFSDVANADYQPPDTLASILRNYQETGYRWLRTMDALGFGGILADDMGLGKTLQVLALLSAVKTEGKPGNRLPSIVICPSSLVLNWESEAARFTPELSVSVVIGSADARKKIIRKARGTKTAKKAGQAPDLFVTSYDLLKRDIESYEGIDFRFVIIDEAQYIKNQTTQNAKSVKLLTGRSRFALTGTPIENTLAELWSIFDFLMPGYLFRYRHFQRVFETPIVKRTDEKAENRLKEMVRPFIMRRLKKDVLKELPEKIETVLKSEMESEQHKLYLANMARTKKELSEKLAAAGGPKAKFEILAALMRMRRICCDPALIYENYSGGSTKLDACMELVESCIASGHRILLFSQFTSMLDRIEARLWDAKIDWYRLDGSTPTAERHSMMNNFNSGDVPVFLISLRAGGTGLNLAGADIVIHYDPWWNISVQNQATDRAHRIGQTNRVQVFKLITKDTIEERIMEMQERKADLADRIIREGGNAFESLTEEELMKLFE
ncbi:MAG: SNF2 family helicase, partial [Clostridiales bacterium]|nr:SNF2 family helicase [Clostridiales bacterium]